MVLAIGGVVFAGAAAGDALRLPSPRPAPYADFYASLRALGDPAAAPDLPEPLRRGAARIALLTEQLPESLPLQTPEHTVLIVHRKNPRYRATIERLLWRRLDPALASVGSADELGDALDRTAADLRPLCGMGADSIHASLARLYQSEFPSYMATIWPSRDDAARGWIRGVRDALRPHETTLLADLGILLAVPIPDTSRVRIFVTSLDLPPAASIPIVRDGRATIVVPEGSGSERESALALLCAYVQACDALAPANAATAARLLSQFVRGSASLDRDLQRSLLRYAISKQLEGVYGWVGLTPAVGDSARAASLRKNWDAYAAGGISLPTACAAIASDASAGGR